MAAEDNRYRAPALDKGLDILELLAPMDDGLSQAEIAKALDRTPNEIYRMLDRLVRRGYVQRTEADRYELSLKLFELAYARPPIPRLVRQALPLMRQFTAETLQACHLVVRDRDLLIVLAQVDSPGYWGVSIRIGARVDPATTGSGRLFLAYASDDERRQLLERSDGNIPEPDASLIKRLAAVRKQGFESTPSLQTVGVTDLAVPILGPLGTIVAVFSCPYMKRLNNSEAPPVQDVLQLLVQYGDKISQRRNTVEQAEAKEH